MQTQGVSLIASEISGMVSAKSTKATDATFQSFMSERASKVESKEQKTDTAAFGTSSSYNEKKMITKSQESRKDIADTSKHDITNSSKTTTETVKPEDVVEELDVTAMNRQMMQMLQELFGLSEEEIQDVLEQMGIGIQDLLFQVQNGEISAVALENLQSLVMEVHGITDKAAFLTNGELSRELNQLVEQTAQIVADALGVSVDEVEQAEQSLVLSFSEQMEQTLKNSDGKQSGEETKSIVDGMQDNVRSQNETDGIRVVVETESTGADEDAQSDSMLSTSEHTSAADEATTDAKNALNLFSEKLEQAFGQDGNQVGETGKTMTQIVEQVVNQVKIRVMPETTSMELQLHPESLGRVNLQVSTTNGAATAVLTVENQVAKEALESQMITLKETFAEQGLKVDAVEVTVSDFGLEHQNREAEQEQQRQASGKRRFRSEVDLGSDEESENAKETDAVRRDVNSVVDYTA